MTAGSLSERTVTSEGALRDALQCAALVGLIHSLPSSDTHPTAGARALDGGYRSVTGRRCLGVPLSFFRVNFLCHGHDGRPGVPARVQRGYVLRVVGVAGGMRMQHPLVFFLILAGVLMSPRSLMLGALVAGDLVGEGHCPYSNVRWVGGGAVAAAAVARRHAAQA